MPSRNRLKAYVSDSYYHIYNRGVNKRRIFLDADDYAVFLNLLKRHLDEQPAKDLRGREYDWLHLDIELLAFCLMPNHFHLLIYQKTPLAMTTLLHRVSGAYTSYFNKKYKRIGPLFQDRFKASMIISDEYLQHISRYIHLNPKNYRTWEFSSLSYYLESKKSGWLDPDRILEMFESNQYRQFVEDHKDYKESLEVIKTELANTDE